MRLEYLFPCGTISAYFQGLTCCDRFRECSVLPDLIPTHPIHHHVFRGENRNQRPTEMNKSQLIEPRKKPSQFLLYWLVNRDPCNGLL